jgi:hypothetical protein
LEESAASNVCLGTDLAFDDFHRINCTIWIKVDSHRNHVQSSAPELSEIDKEAYGRFFGAILLAFMIFAAYEIFHDGLAAAYNNFGR